jgi:hypothetical protein
MIVRVAGTGAGTDLSATGLWQRRRHPNSSDLLIVLSFHSSSSLLFCLGLYFILKNLRNDSISVHICYLNNKLALM